MKNKILLALFLISPLYATNGTNDSLINDDNKPTPVKNEEVSFKKRLWQTCRGEYMHLHDPSFIKSDDFEEELKEEEQASYSQDFKYIALTPLIAGDYIVNSPAFWLKAKHPNTAKKLYYKGYNDIHAEYAKGEYTQGTVQLGAHALKCGTIISLFNTLFYLIKHRLGLKNSFKIGGLKFGIHILCLAEYMLCDYAVRNTAMSDKWHLITPIIVALTFLVLNYFANKYVVKVKESVVVKLIKREQKKVVDKTSWTDIIFKLITPKSSRKEAKATHSRQTTYNMVAKITLPIIGLVSTLLLASYRAK